MKIDTGFKIDRPDIFVPWGITEHQLTKLFVGMGITFVTNGYYVADCESLGGLKCKIGFHFDPLESGRLNELEFFRTDYLDQQKSYEEFQHVFERSFGRPTQSRMGSEGFEDHLWKIENIYIYHTISERFGPEERMTIKVNT